MIHDSGRINFKFNREFESGWTGSAVAEWGFWELDRYNAAGNSNEEKSDLWYNRLGNVGMSHDTYGSFVAGKQWSAYFDIAGWTDQFVLGGSHALGVYDEGNVTGTARPDAALTYRNSFGGLNVALQYQFEDWKHQCEKR